MKSMHVMLWHFVEIFLIISNFQWTVQMYITFLPSQNEFCWTGKNPLRKTFQHDERFLRYIWQRKWSALNHLQSKIWATFITQFFWFCVLNWYLYHLFATNKKWIMPSEFLTPAQVSESGWKKDLNCKYFILRRTAETAQNQKRFRRKMDNISTSLSIPCFYLTNRLFYRSYSSNQSHPPVIDLKTALTGFSLILCILTSYACRDKLLLRTWDSHNFSTQNYKLLHVLSVYHTMKKFYFYHLFCS